MLVFSERLNFGGRIENFSQVLARKFQYFRSILAELFAGAIGDAKLNGPTKTVSFSCKEMSVPNLLYFSSSGLALGESKTLAPYSKVASLFHVISLHSGHQRALLSAFPASLGWRLRKVQ